MTAIEARLRFLSVITMLTLFGVFSMLCLISNSTRCLNRPVSKIATHGLAASHQDHHVFAVNYDLPSSLYRPLSNIDTTGLVASRHDHDVPLNNHDPSDALILTYMRSGSSFVGTVLGWRKDTFYWYEPMWKTHKWYYLSGDHLMCNYSKPGCKTISGNTMLSIDRNLQFFLDIYKCDNLTKHWERYGRMQKAPAAAGPIALAFQECMRMPSRPRMFNKPHSAKACFETVMERCPKAKHKVLKALRLETAHAQFLLEQHERLKLVQIFRDPRAVIYSRLISGWYYQTANTTEADIQVLCKRMSKDIDDIKTLKTWYPERVKIIQYEDFSDPYRLAIHLYSFLNMEMTKSAEHLLQTLAPKGTAKRKGFHPDSYRSSLDWKVNQSITKHCRSVLERLGLRIFEKETDLRNISLSVVLGDLPFKID